LGNRWQLTCFSSVTLACLIINLARKEYSDDCSSTTHFSVSDSRQNELLFELGNETKCELQIQIICRKSYR
jgi:hypothetical protein